MKEAILIGGGKSVKDGIELGLWNKIKGKDIWSINYAWMTMPYLPSREIFVDISFFKLNVERLEALYKQGVPFYAKAHPKLVEIPEIITYPVSRESIDFNNPNKLFSGKMGLSGTFAISLACREKYDRIYLLGYDFGTKYPNEILTHYYQGKLNVFSEGLGKSELYRAEKNIDKINPAVEDYKLFTTLTIDIINVSIDSNINYFEKID